MRLPHGLAVPLWRACLDYDEPAGPVLCDRTRKRVYFFVRAGRLESRELPGAAVLGTGSSVVVPPYHASVPTDQPASLLWMRTPTPPGSGHYMDPDGLERMLADLVAGTTRPSTGLPNRLSYMGETVDQVLDESSSPPGPRQVPELIMRLRGQLMELIPILHSMADYRPAADLAAVIDQARRQLADEAAASPEGVVAANVRMTALARAASALLAYFAPPLGPLRARTEGSR
ncbi:DUF6415 family natural product biosynthesis protein [Streptomyces sp. H27-D2]|uniref:DUF6415 family natural product biosynthesis protein n=1 Tax=Streptomyces sp. H27-D2 TaxID=3046304 RepID=UPI002DB96082|nr:DUF6415 family natural product biosynthesis protein [Streptomyces sp. H27-D2]MEC4019700.1 DUF6415 family natural product biosynthesis protein [Streptomyces sp. H27-D2]